MSNQNKSITFESRDFTVDEDSRSYSGYGIVFNSDSHPMRVWTDDGIVEVREQITRTLIDEADMSDLVGTFNHNFDKVLGRTDSGTMTYQVDDIGVKYRFTLPETTYANDLIQSTKRGDVKGSSFMFSMDWAEGYDISEREDGSLLAIPKKITRIHEMGPVVKPAYPETTAQNRSEGLATAVNNFVQQRKQAENKENTQDWRKRKIKLLKIKSV